MIGTAPLSFDRANEQVEDMIQQGMTFARVEDAIEDAIEDARLSQNYKAALWPLAWSLPDSALQRRDARMMAEALAGGRQATC